MKSITLLALIGCVNASSLLLGRAIGDMCKAPEGSGTCQKTSNCKGIAYPNGYCPNDPTDVQCCLNINCNTPNGSGICRHTNQGCPSGSFVPGTKAPWPCPGDNTIQCCVGGSGSGTPTSKPAPAPTVDTCKTPQPDTCTFYPNCLEAREKCGTSGYPIGYGLRYCNLFTAAKSKMTSAGQAWVTKTMLCLQNKLVPYGTGQASLTCLNLKEFAFATHPDCYVKSGVCTLPPADWKVIIETVSLKELFGSLDALKATMQTMEGCAELYTWLAEQGIIKIIDKAEDVAKDIWHKVSSWF